MPTVHFVKQGKTVDCPVGTNIRELALRNEIDLYAFPANLVNCRGHALCGTCRIKIDDVRAVSAQHDDEKAKVGWEGPQYRLACRAKILADLQITTNPRARNQGWTSHPTYKWMEQLPD